MQRSSFGWVVTSLLGAALIIGCAVGTDPGAVGESDLLTLPVEAGDENSVYLPPRSQPPTDEDSGAGGTGDAAGGDAGTKPDAAADAGADAGTGGTTSCASPNTCVGATDLGTISGDTGADVRTATGSGSQWFKIRVTENDSGVFAVPLLTKAELTSPPGTNFDVFLYVASNGSNQECSAVSGSSTTTGFDTTTVQFGESGTFSNGAQDDRTVTVEVRWVSGTCAPGAKWSLTVRGNTP